MKFSLQELRRCLDAAAELERRYVAIAAPSPSPKKLRDHFLPLARAYTGKQVDAYELDTLLPHESILGSCVAEDDGFSILIYRSSTGHDEAQVRYVLCKEIFHALLYDDGSNATDVCGHLDGIAISFPVKDSEPNAAVKSEVLAEIAAQEFLFPYKDRVEELKAGNVDYAKIAEKYQIPQYYVEICLSSDYMKELGAMVGEQFGQA